MSKEIKNKPIGEIVIYQDRGKNIKIETRFENETVWLNQEQISSLFDAERSVITKHLGNIFKSGELDEKSNVQKMHFANSDKLVKFYNLDAIISVGYRVNSRRATQFRIWATNVVKNHIIRGYTINKSRISDLKERQLSELESAVSLIKKTIETKRLSGAEERGLLRVITDYANSWVLLQKYDKNELKLPGKVKIAKFKLTCQETENAIFEFKDKLISKRIASDLFGVERDKSLSGIIGNLYQSFGGKELYFSIEEKAAHLLYFIIKDHPFIDGNKRIGSFLFILFLARNNYLLKKNGEKKINDNALVALALLIAESDAKQKEVIIKLIMNFING
ncbi:MAG: virulence protein RhuM/Fic/DOC family protein [Patescibacteria group bacterium]